MIQSVSNGQIKNILQLQKKSKARREQSAFVVEGIKMVSETPKDQLLQIYASTSFLQQKNPDRQPELQNQKIIEVSDAVFREISDTVTPQGILAVVRQKNVTIEELFCLPSPKRFLVLENLQDPGNLGTMIRTAEGAGISGVILSKNSVDIYNPKVIRSTMGAIYRVPFLYVEDIFKIAGLLKQQKITSFAAHLQGEINCYEADYKKDIAFFIGNEASGLSPKLAELADIWIRIPMEGKLESLNAAVAAAILMYEAKRQIL